MLGFIVTHKWIFTITERLCRLYMIRECNLWILLKCHFKFLVRSRSLTVDTFLYYLAAINTVFLSSEIYHFYPTLYPTMYRQ